MGYRVCIVCQDVSNFGVLVDKRIHKTVCGPLCMAVLMDWAQMPDPKPSLMQVYLNRKHPEHAPHSVPDEDPEGDYAGSF